MTLPRSVQVQSHQGTLTVCSVMTLPRSVQVRSRQGTWLFAVLRHSPEVCMQLQIRHLQPFSPRSVHAIADSPSAAFQSQKCACNCRFPSAAFQPLFCHFSPYWYWYKPFECTVMPLLQKWCFEKKASCYTKQLHFAIGLSCFRATYSSAKLDPLENN